MKREEIEKAAVDSCVIENSIFNPELTPYYEQGFADGADWRINSVWHDASEKPVIGRSALLIYRGGGSDITSNVLSFEFWDSVNKWAYIEDLLPAKNN